MAASVAVALPGPDGEPGARRFPIVLVSTFAVIAFTAAITAGWLRFLGGLTVRSWVLGCFALSAISSVGAIIASIRRRSSDVQRAEARMRRFFRPPRRLKLTREGKYFVGISLGVGFAAINTGNNLLYLLLGMMLSLIIASGILSEMSLRGLRILREPPARIHAGQPALVGIALTNGKSRLPSFSIEVEDVLDGDALDKRCWFLKVPAGKTQRTAWRHTFSRRGRYRFTSFRLSTRFPFALFRKSRLVDAEGEIIVYPAIVAIESPPPPIRGRAGDESGARRSRRGEFYGLRDYREGDDVRDVHWRSTAKRGRLLIREHEEEESRRVTLFVDNALPGGAACEERLLHEALERAVSLAASLASHYLARGFQVRVVARGEALGWAQDVSHLDRVLRMLALLPTVEPDVQFADRPQVGVETLLIARRGAPLPAGNFGRTLQA